MDIASSIGIGVDIDKAWLLVTVLSVSISEIDQEPRDSEMGREGRTRTGTGTEESVQDRQIIYSLPIEPSKSYTSPITLSKIVDRSCFAQVCDEIWSRKRHSVLTDGSSRSLS